MCHTKEVQSALEAFPNGLTVAELSHLLGRTGGDVTKAVSLLKKQQVRINTYVVFNPYNGRRTVRYVLVREENLVGIAA